MGERLPCIATGGRFILVVGQKKNSIAFWLVWPQTVCQCSCSTMALRCAQPSNDWPLSGVGHSIGRWEGDTLIVETARLKPGTLFNNGIDYSEQIRLTERFRLGTDGSTLVVTQEFKDPNVFIGAAARVLPLERIEGHVYPYECDPGYGLAIESRELQGEP